MDIEVVLGVFAVIDGVCAERHVSDDEIKAIVGKGSLFKSLDLNVRVRVKFLCDPARDTVEFHAVEPCAVRDLSRHKPEEIARSHCRLQDTVIAFDTHFRERLVDSLDDFFGSIVSVQNACLCPVVIFKR